MLLFGAILIALCIADVVIAKLTIVPGLQERNMLRVFFGLAAMLGTLLIACSILMSIFLVSAQG